MAPSLRWMYTLSLQQRNTRAYSFGEGDEAMVNRLVGRDILSVAELDKDEISYVLDVAEEFEAAFWKGELRDLLAGRVVVPLFYVEDPWLRASFESAVCRLGGRLISNPGAAHGGPAPTGAALAARARWASVYGDLIVHRHAEVFSAHEAAKGAVVPVINAGDGTYEDPCQALADLYTLRNELGEIEGLSISLVGDLKHSRFAHSLVRALSHWDVSIRLVSPPNLKMATVLTVPLKQVVSVVESRDIASGLEHADAVYAAPIEETQLRRASEAQVARDWLASQIALLKKTAPDIAVMCPTPQADWLDLAPADPPASAAYGQAVNGVWVRAAVVALILGALPL